MKKEKVLKYPRKSPYLSYKRIGKDEYRVEDYLHSRTFRMDGNTAVFLKSLDGRTNPYHLLAGYRKDDIRKVIRDFKNKDLLAPKKKLLTLGTWSCLYPLFYCYPGKTQKILARLFNFVLMIMFIPMFVLGLWIHINGIRNVYVQGKGELFAGMLLSVVVGIALHELAHTCAGLAYGGHLFEIGIGTHYFMPMGYVLLDDTHIKNRLHRIQIDAAGIEMNLLLYGVFMLLVRAGFISPFVIYLAAIENLVLAIVNLLPLDGLDGIRILSILFHKKDLIKHARKMIKQRNRVKRTPIRFAELTVSYALVGFQIVMPLMMVYEGYSLIKLILL